MSKGLFNSLTKKTAAVSLAVLLIGGAALGSCGAHIAHDINIAHAEEFLEQEGYELDDYAYLNDESYDIDNINTSKITSIKSDEVYLTMNKCTIPSDFDKLSETKNVGLIVTPPSKNIYLTISAIMNANKGLDNDEPRIKLPIYYNIDNDLDIETNLEQAKLFCKILEANGFYVGLYGTNDSMISFCSQLENSQQYDKMISLSNKEEEVTYKGIYHSVILPNGKIYSNYNLSEIIDKNNLNKPSNYLTKYEYTIVPNDNLTSISKKFNISIDDLCYWNDIDDPNIISVGNVLVIPNTFIDEYGNIININNNEKTILKGIDVSRWQGKINWDKVASEVDFAILRAMNGELEIDSEFITNIKACEKLSIPVGVYFYSNASTKEEIIKEIDTLISKLSNYTLEYPIFIDAESDKMMSLSDEELANVLNEGCLHIAESGYQPGIYINSNRYSSVKDLEWPCWITNSETYNDEINFSSFKKESYSLDGHILTDVSNIQGVQYSQCGMINGIDGYVDIDYFNPSLTKKIVKSDDYQLKLQ